MIRRTFIDWMARVGLLTVSGTAACDCSGDEKPGTSEPPAPPAEEPLGFFSEEEGKVMRAALERILPEDEPPGSPGAERAGVIHFIDRELQKEHFKPFAPLFRNGARYLDVVAKREAGGPFAEVKVTEQDRILGQFQTRSVENLRYPTDRFFELLHGFALEGYLGHPRHGGNKDKLAWQWVEIDPSCRHMFFPEEG